MPRDFLAGQSISNRPPRDFLAGQNVQQSTPSIPDMSASGVMRSMFPNKEKGPSLNNLKDLFYIGSNAGRDLGEDLLNAMKWAKLGIPKNWDLQKIQEGSDKDKIAAQMLGAAPLFEVGGAAGEAAPLLKSLPMLGRAVGSGVTGAAISPEGQRAKVGLLSAALSPLADIGIKAAKVGAQPIETIKTLLNPRATPEQIQGLSTILQKQGIKMPAGDIAQSSPLKRLQTVLKNVPFTGIEKGHEQLAKYVKNYGEDFYNGLEGSDIKDLHGEVYNRMKAGYQKNIKTYQAQLSDFNKNADKINAEPTMDNVKNAMIDHSVPIVDQLSGLMGSEELSPNEMMRSPNLINALDKDDKSTAMLINKYGRKKVARFGGEGNTFETLYRNLNKDLSDQAKQQNWKSYSTLKDMKESVLQDMKDSVGDNGNLANQFAKTNSYYKNNVVPYQTVRVAGRNQKTPFFKVYNTEDENTGKFIDSYLKPGAQKDQHVELHRLLNLLPEKSDRDLINAYHFKPAVESINNVSKINNEKLVSQYQKLGSTQKQLLLGDKTDDFDNLQTLKKSFPDAFKLDYSPKQGLTMAKLAEMLGGIGLAASGHIYPAMAVSALPIMGGRLATGSLRSPALLKMLASKEGSPLLQKLQALLPTIKGAALGAALPTPTKHPKDWLGENK